MEKVFDAINVPKSQPQIHQFFERGVVPADEGVDDGSGSLPGRRGLTGSMDLLVGFQRNWELPTTAVLCWILARFPFAFSSLTNFLRW